MQSRKAQVQAVEDQKQTRTSRVNKRPSWISPYEVLQSWLIDTVLHVSVKNNKGEAREGLKDRGDLLTFFPWRAGGGA